MITFSAARFGSYLFESVTQSRPGKKFLFSLPLILSISSSIFRSLYNSPFITHTLGALGGQFIFKSITLNLPKSISETIVKNHFIPEHLHAIYLIILIATLTLSHFSLYIAIPLSFFTAVLTGYLYDERDKLTLIYYENQPQPLVYT